MFEESAESEPGSTTMHAQHSFLGLPTSWRWVGDVLSRTWDSQWDERYICLNDRINGPGTYIYLHTVLHEWLICMVNYHTWILGVLEEHRSQLHVDSLLSIGNHLVCVAVFCSYILVASCIRCSSCRSLRRHGITLRTHTQKFTPCLILQSCYSLISEGYEQ